MKQENSIPVKRKHSRLKKAGIVLGVLILVFGILYAFLTSHTQVIVGFIQYLNRDTGTTENSYEPINPPMEGVLENGQYKITEVCYNTEYPNSFLDIIYPDENIEADRPTLFYFHGGGFFYGSKNMGDPMAASESTALVDDLCAAGYNIVNVDYALVPEYLFPTPVIQMNEAIRYMEEHKDEYHLNMDQIVLMGSSAGAIMTAQYGTVVTNPEYAALLEIEPAINREQIGAVVIDDGPIDYENLNLITKFLIGNYVSGTIYLNEDELNRYNCIPYMTSDYPAAFLLGSMYRKDMIAMDNRLNEVNGESVLIDPLEEIGEWQPHCYIVNERVDPVAKDAFERLIVFLQEKILETSDGTAE